MRTVIWEDKDGWKHRSLVRDSDPDEAAPGGIPHDPPDLDRMDWDGVKRDIHNRLVESGVMTWDDLQRSGINIKTVILSATKRRLVRLFRDDTEV